MHNCYLLSVPRSTLRCVLGFLGTLLDFSCTSYSSPSFLNLRADMTSAIYQNKTQPRCATIPMAKDLWIKHDHQPMPQAPVISEQLLLHVGCVAHYKVGDHVSLKFGPHDNICTSKATCFPSRIAISPLPLPPSPCSQHLFLCPFHIQTHLTANLATGLLTQQAVHCLKDGELGPSTHCAAPRQRCYTMYKSH